MPKLTLPNPDVPMVAVVPADRAGKPTKQWHQDLQALVKRVNELEERLEELEDEI